MDTKSDLSGSFGSLLDTLTNRLDPMQPASVLTRWLATINRAAAIARNVAGWNALPPQSPAYTPVIAALDAGVRALVVADYDDPNSVKAALAVADDALVQLKALF